MQIILCAKLKDQGLQYKKAAFTLLYFTTNRLLSINYYVTYSRIKCQIYTHSSEI